MADHVNAACDALDGLADGVVNNYLACPSGGDIATLRCAGGADLGNTCLSDAQLATLNAAYGPTVMPFPLANALTTYPGRLYGGELQINGEGVGRWVTNGQTPSQQPRATDARGIIHASSYARYVIARDANFDIRTYATTNFQQRIQEVSALMDSTNSDLAAFREVATNHDLLSTLDQWVTTGTPPSDALSQVRNSTVAPYPTLARRPMCRYPNHPQ